MNISIVSVFPELYEPFLGTSLVARAQESHRVSFDITSFFSYVVPKERIDAPTYGPGAGMLIKPEVVAKAIEDKERTHGTAYKIFFSPQGKKLDQNLLKHIATKSIECGHVLLIPARYEGMDARVEQEYADIVVSVGDFVLMGGDLPAMVLLEGMLRLVPGVVGKAESVQEESFSGPFTDYPEYTEPVSWKGHEVPAIVRSGNHEQIRQWRMQQAASTTVKRHFSWLRSYPALAPEQKKSAAACIPSHYVALLHSNVLIGPERKEGTTSVTSLDIHDIARSARTYGIKNYYIVTPLHDQKKIVQTLLDFWQTGAGIDYNKERHEAVKSVRVVDALAGVIQAIEEKEGKKPLLIATSARSLQHEKCITFYDQETVWQSDRPVLFIFGTGKGLTDQVVQECDFLLPPLDGFSDFRHLSVRSAVAIILDRWLGINPSSQKQ